MANVQSRVLVIDASIARAAGDVSLHPTSRRCREFLTAVREHGHSLVMTNPIRDEWDRHQSRFARLWRTSMFARKQIRIVEVPSHLSLESRVARVVTDSVLVAIVDKDRRLIEAALVTEKRITSLDDRVRKHLEDHIDRLPEVRPICWVNPDRDEETALDWLATGAPAERRRLLGFVTTPRRR